MKRLMLTESTQNSSVLPCLKGVKYPVCAHVKRIVISIAFVILCSGLAFAQKPADTTTTRAAEVKMPAAYAKQLKEKLEESAKFAEDNSKLVSMWQQYTATQQAIQAEVTKIVLRAALAARMTVEQVDASDLRADGKDGFVWVPKAKPESASTTGKPNN